MKVGDRGLRLTKTMFLLGWDFRSFILSHPRGIVTVPGSHESNDNSCVPLLKFESRFLMLPEARGHEMFLRNHKTFHFSCWLLSIRR
jgi:hypothetical protein